MSAPPRGPRGGRGPRNRGGGAANSSRTKPSDGNESDSSRRPAQRGRGRGTNSQNHSRGIAQAFQNATRQQNAPRRGNTLRGGSRATTPTPTSSVDGNTASLASKRANETPEQRFHRVRDERESNRNSFRRRGIISGSSLGLMNAVAMVGLCQDMCPEYERARRIYQRDVWGPEKVVIASEDGTTTSVVDESKMVKRFARSAAGTDEQTPTDLRPPTVLLRTTDYLFNDILSDENSLAKCNGFIWDRTRAIRNDFSIQQVKKVTDVRSAIECFEKIARYHILSLHQIGTKGKDVAGDSYDWQQDREQLDKTLLSLITYYDKVKKRYRSPNEAEFRAYWIIFQIGNITTYVEDKVQSWPADLLHNKRIQRALDVYAAASDIMSHKGPLQPYAMLAVAQQNWQKYWNLVASKQTSYLLACVAEIGFNLIRRVILTAVSMTYNPGGKKEVQDWTLEKMAEILGFDDEDTTRDYLEKSKLGIGEAADGTQYLQLSVRTLLGLPDPEPDLPRQTLSWHLVERKRFGRSWSALIAGMSFKVAKENGMLSPDWAEEVKAHSSQDDGLFVEDEAQPAAAKPPTQANPFASVFKPNAPPTTENKPAAINPFGQPSPFGQSSAGLDQSATTSPFGQPSPAAPTSQAIVPAASSSTTGSFGPLPKPFSFSTPASAGPAAVAISSSTSSANPFASFAVPGKPQPSVALKTPNPAAASPFSGFAPKSIAESSQPASNPFVGLGAGLTAKKPSDSGSSPFAPATAPNALAIPSVQVTPPQVDVSATKLGLAVAAPQPKPAFESPANSGGFSFGPQSTGQFIPMATGATTSPFSFSANPSPEPTPKPAESELSGTPQPPARPLFPQKAPAPVSTQVQQPAQPFAPAQTPLTALSPAVSATVSGGQTFNALAAQPGAKKQVTFAHQSPASHLSTPGSSNESAEGLREHARRTKGMDYLAERVMCDAVHGLFNEYIAHIAKPMIEKAMRLEEKRLAKEEANKHRTKFLMGKYGRLWRKLAASLKSRRKRLEMKKRNAEARQKRMSMVSGNANGKEKLRMSIDEEHALFKAQEEQRARDQAEASTREREQKRASLLGDPQQHTARTSATNSFDLIGQRHVESMAPPANASINKSAAGASRGHQRSKTQPNVLALHNGLHRVSKLSREASPALSTASSRSSITRASLINGGSLAESGLPFGKKASTMQSPYFRLKAAGFGPTLKNTFVSSISGVKRPRLSGDDILSNGSLYGDEAAVPAPKRFRSPTDLTSFSSPVRPPQSNLAASFGSSTSSNGAYKRSAEDEDLLARARRLREALEESENWFKDEVQKDELRHSQELRRSQLGGSRPPSEAGSPSGPNGEDLSKLPKFYSRVSRFVPREEYGIRKEKKELKEEPKGKEKMNGSRLSNGTGSGRRPNTRQMPPPPAPPKPSPGQGGTSWDDAIEL